MTPLERADDEAETRLIQGKGQAHEQAYLEHIRARGTEVADMRAGPKTLDEAVARTLEAMRAGVEVIYQGALRTGRLAGYTDFLRRVSRPSALGDYSYEVVDTKLARTAKASALLQLVFYSDLLAAAQGTPPATTTSSSATARNALPGRRLHPLLRDAEGALPRARRRGGADHLPRPLRARAICHWRDRCEAQRLADDHLVQVADIRRSQIKRLTEVGSPTLAALAQTPAGTRIKGIQPETLERLHQQAALQLGKRETEKSRYEVLPSERSPGAAWRACRRRTRATSSSTWKAIRWRKAASNTSSASASSTGELAVPPVLGAHARRGAAGFRSSSWISWPRAWPASRAHIYHYAATRRRR